MSPYSVNILEKSIKKLFMDQITELVISVFGKQLKKIADKSGIFIKLIKKTHQNALLPTMT